MSRSLIAVTGVGGTAGYSLAQRLHECGYEVLGMDADPLSPGFVHTERARPVPSSDDPNFLSEIRDLCRKEKPAALVSTIESELLEMAGSPDVFKDLDTRTWIPDAEYLRRCVDKFVFFEFLSDCGVGVPLTVLADSLTADSAFDEFDDVELIVKPRYGRGTKDTFRCHRVSQARALTEVIPDLVVQPKIEGTEFTADCLVDTSGRASVVLRARRRTKAGVSVVGETISSDPAISTIRDVLAMLGASGICNVQGFLAEAGPTVHITEVNPRFSGGFPLSERAGARLTEEYMNGLFGRPINHENLGYRTGVVMRRYFTEVFEENSGTEGHILQQVSVR